MEPDVALIQTLLNEIESLKDEIFLLTKDRDFWKEKYISWVPVNDGKGRVLC